MALIKILKNGKLVAYSTLRVTLKMVGRHFDAKLHYVIDKISLSVQQILKEIIRCGPLKQRVRHFFALINILKNGKLVAYSTLRVTLKTGGRHFDAKLHYVIDAVPLSV